MTDISVTDVSVTKHKREKVFPLQCHVSEYLETSCTRYLRGQCPSVSQTAFQGTKSLHFLPVPPLVSAIALWSKTEKTLKNCHLITYFPTSERCEQMSERMSKWPSISVCILGSSGQYCTGFCRCQIEIFAGQYTGS